MIGGLDQGGLGLPDRDYYLSDDSEDEGDPRGLPTPTWRTMFDAARGRSRGRGEEGGAGDGRSRPRLAKAALDQRRAPRPEEGLPPPRSRGPEEAGAEPRRGTRTSPRLGTAGASQALNVTHPAFFDEVDAAGARRRSPRELAARTSPGVCVSLAGARAAQARSRTRAFASAARPSPARRRTSRGGRSASRPPTRASGEALGAVPFVEQTFGADGKATTIAMVEQIEQAFEPTSTR